MRKFRYLPCQKGKKGYYYRYKNDDIATASRRQYEESPAFKDRYRYRAGVEAAMSEFDRRTGVKNLQVKGMKAVSFAVVMKAIGLNVFKASRHKRRTNPTSAPYFFRSHSKKKLLRLI